MAAKNLPEVLFDSQNHSESKDYFLATCSAETKNMFFFITNAIGFS